MLDRIRRLFERVSDMKAIAALSDRDLLDLGITRDQAQHMAALPEDVPGRVTAMARIFGLTEQELLRDRSEWVELLETCHACTELAACRRLLRQPDRATPGQAEFCPNREHFAHHAQVPG